MRRRVSPSRRVRLSIWALALVVVVIGAMALFRDDRIDARGVPVVSTNGWQTYHGSAGYFWLRNGDLLYFKKSDFNHVSAFRQSVTPAAMAQPPATVHVFPIAPPWMPFTLSPDEKWLTCARPMRGPVEIVVAPLAAPESRFTPLFQASTHNVWSADSRSLFQIELSPSPPPGSLTYRLSIHHPEGGAHETIPLPRELNVNAWCEGLSQVLPSGHLLLRRNRDAQLGSMRLPSTRALTFADFDPLRPSTAPRIWSVPVPRDALRGDISVSPLGDKLLWMLVTPRPTLLEDLLHRLMPQRPWPSRQHVVWRISRMDGSHIRDIGAYDTFDPEHYADTWIWPQWTPDGRHLSFVKNGSLYLLPAD